MSRAILYFAFFASATAQDPAEGWLAYSRVLPPGGKPGQRLTFISAKWKNLGNPRHSSAFYSPWFGIDTSDNLNLLQPVNPWLGNEWQIYNEYYQWSPSHNQNSQSHKVTPGMELYGSITYDAATNSYDVYHNSSDGWEVHMPIKIQKDKKGGYKNYSIAYFVFEKTAPCGDYPPDNVVTFYDVNIQWDGASPADAAWSTGVVDEVCQFTAKNNVPSTSNGTVTISWSTAAADPAPEKISLSQRNKTLSGRVPAVARKW